MKPAIKLQNAKARFAADTPLVLDIDTLTIEVGERVALIGPSGAGKTSLLRLINGYIELESGTLQILGQLIDAPDQNKARQRNIRRRVGFIFQDFSLVERATVFNNVLWGRLGRLSTWRTMLGSFPEQDKLAAMEAITEVDLYDKANQRVDTLSGGQQQRVGVARVLAQEAEILLADEPVSNLDPSLAEEILELLSTVTQGRGATLVMSLHQPEWAAQFADRIIGLRHGRIVFDQPAKKFDAAAMAQIYERELE